MRQRASSRPQDAFPSEEFSIPRLITLRRDGEILAAGRVGSGTVVIAVPDDGRGHKDQQFLVVDLFVACAEQTAQVGNVGQDRDTLAGSRLLLADMGQNVSLEEVW